MVGKRLKSGVVVACAGVMFAAGASFARQVEEAADKGSVRWGLSLGGDDVGRMSVQTMQNGRTLVINTAGDEKTVTVDGQVIPSDRVKWHDGGVSVTTGDGDELFFPVDLAGAPGGALFRATGLASPKSMLGVRLAAVPESLAKQFGLDPGAATLINDVLPGLPAAKSGLMAGDVVLELDGSSPGTRDRIQEFMRQLSPGDVLTFDVLRNGDRRRVEVQLEAYDRQRMSGGDVGLLGQALVDVDVIDSELKIAELRAVLADRAAEVADLAQLVAERRGARGREAAEKMSAMGEEMVRLSEQIALLSAEQRQMMSLRQFGDVSGRAQTQVPGGIGLDDRADRLLQIIPQDGSGQGFVFASPGVVSTDQMSDAIEKAFDDANVAAWIERSLDGQWHTRAEEVADDLNDRLDGLERQLDEVHERLDDLSELDRRLDRIERLLERLADDRR